MFKIDATTTTSVEAPDYFGANARLGVKKSQQRPAPMLSVENDKETAMMIRLSAIALVVSTVAYVFYSCYAHGVAVVG